MRTRSAILTGMVISGLLVAMYEIGLTAEAKKSLNDAVSATKRTIIKVQEKLKEAEDKQRSEGELRERLLRISEQWETLGY